MKFRIEETRMKNGEVMFTPMVREGWIFWKPIKLEYHYMLDANPSSYDTENMASTYQPYTTYPSLDSAKCAIEFYKKELQEKRDKMDKLKERNIVVSRKVHYKLVEENVKI